MKADTLWGVPTPSHHKKRGGGVCGRPGCTKPRHVTKKGLKRGYCLDCTAEWSKRRRDAAAVRMVR